MMDLLRVLMTTRRKTSYAENAKAQRIAKAQERTEAEFVEVTVLSPLFCSLSSAFPLCELCTSAPLR
jgi:hypothetical protein